MLHRKKRISAAAAPFILAILILIVFTPHKSHAVNIYDGSHAPDGLYFLTYAGYYFADTYTDYEGSSVSDQFGLNNTQELFRLAYYRSGLVLTAMIPLGGLYIDSLGKGSFGSGDSYYGGGYFLPIDSIDILPMLFVKAPTGRYSANSPVNYGSNQWDIIPELFIHKTATPVTIDFVAKYFIKFKNNSTGITPGNELHLQTVLGFMIHENMKIGPSISWLRGEDDTGENGTRNESARELLSLGGDLYARIAGKSFCLTYLYDFYSRNKPKGHYVQLKTVLKIL